MTPSIDPQDQAWLLAAAQEALLLVDGDTLQVRAVSGSVQRLLGHAPAAVVGLNVTALECALTDAFFWDEMAGRDHASAESAYRHADGRVIAVVKHVSRLRQQPLLYGVALYPLTDHSAATDELTTTNARLGATLEATADGLLLEGPDGRLLNMNRRFAQMWQVPEDLLLQHDDAAIMAHVAAQTVTVDTQQPLDPDTDSPQRGMQAQVRHLSDGRVIDCRSHQAYVNNQLLGRVYSFRDQTDLYRVQDQLIAARDAARQATAAKSRFLATMSHEIRTPMNGILGMAQLLLQRDLDAGTQQDYVQVILKSGQSLLALLNDILDLSKIEAGKLHLEQAPVRPQELLRDTCALYGGAAAQKRLTLSCTWSGPAGVSYLSDPHRLRQMLANLLGNAIKFTASGAVTVTGTQLSVNGDTALLEFAVQDTGIGIAPDKLPLLFQPFSQADSSTTRRFGGTGLGLSIVRSLAELLGGEVGVSSEPGRGARFWFTVRAQRAPDAPVAAPESAPDGHASRRGLKALNPQARVLVAEDNPVNQLVIRGLLDQFGVQVDVVSDGNEVLSRLARAPRPDLLLMDLNMPGMDGLEAATCIRQLESDQPDAARLPIVALTADAFEEDRLRCLAAGMDDFLPKPVSIDALRATLQRWLRPADA